MVRSISRWVVVIVGLLTFASQLDVAQSQSVCVPGTDFLAQGQASYNSGDYAGSIAVFTCAIEANSVHYEAYWGRFQSAALAHRYSMAVNDANTVKDFARPLLDNALADYNMTLSMDTSNVQTYTLRALVYWSLAEDQMVLDDSARILQLDPQNALAYLLRGSSNQYLGDRLTPPADFTQAALLEPDNADLFAIIGSTYVQTGDTIDAFMYLDRAIQIDPANARSYYFRGLILMGETNYTAAVADFSRAIEVDTFYLDPYYDRGLTYARQGDYTQAINDFNQILDINANFELAYLSRGGVYDMSGDTQSATTDFMQYVRLNQEEQIAGQPLASGIPMSLEMNTGRVYTLPITAQAGQMLNITASSPLDQADPLIVLLNTDGALPLMGNDDQVVGAYTAAIENFSIPASGTYTLLVTHSDGGEQGIVDVNVTMQ